jgi:hypothetical protein
MKSSLAKTFEDAATGGQPSDRFFPARPTAWSILDETGAPITGTRVLVFGPVDEKFGPSAKTSTLLVNAVLRAEYEKLHGDIDSARVSLIAALKKQGGTKADIESDISMAYTRRPNEFETAMGRIQPEIQKESEAPFAAVQYDKIFNEQVLKAITSEDLAGLIATYTAQYNSLLEKSVFFRKGTFDYYNAAEIAKSLANHGFFKAKHTVRLYGAGEPREIKDKKELEALIEEEKAAILSDAALRKTFDNIFKKLTANTAVREFAGYISQPENEPILSRLDNAEAFRQDVFKSYIKANEEAYNDLMSKIEAARAKEADLRAAASKERTRWAEVIDIFNDRFVVPFRLEMRNVVDVVLGREALPQLGFQYVDGDDKATVDRDKLLGALSSGERRAYYILNVIFEIETRFALGQETLVIVDDVADSFDYQNKYAIIQYLMDIKIEKGQLFKQIIMTHNFDFFRTVSSRFVGYGHCLMVEKTGTGIILNKAEGIRNIFARDWKIHFFDDDKKKIASIPFLRNLVEFTKGDEDQDYIGLTSMLHWMPDTAKLKIADLDKLYTNICGGTKESPGGDRLIIDVIAQAADDCMGAPTGMNFEKKVVLAIAVRMRAEIFMTNKIKDEKKLANVGENRTHGMLTLFKAEGLGAPGTIGVLDRVALVTPENIHLNSFMYEPIIDMSDEQLRRLWTEVKGLA